MAKSQCKPQLECPKDRRRKQQNTKDPGQWLLIEQTAAGNSSHFICISSFPSTLTKDFSCFLNIPKPMF